MSLNDLRTLTDIVDAHAASISTRIAIVADDGQVTFGEMQERSTRIAGWLANAGIGPRDRVVLLLPNGSSFLVAFYGVLRLNATAVPLFPRSGTERIAGLVAQSGARAIVASAETLTRHQAGLSTLMGSSAPMLLDIADGLAWSVPFTGPAPEPEDVAFIQFTSGTTSASKGVLLSHRNLVENVRSMIRLENYFGPNDVFVSWLPVHHDMGLILLTMLPYRVGAPVVLLPTTLHVGRWLRAIETWKGTVTGAPDFAYRFAMKLSGSTHPNLSSLRIAFNGAEPVRASTITAFEERFGVRNVVRPCYGLAECSVGVTMSELGGTVRTNDRGVASVGSPLPGIEVAVISEEGGRLETGEVGQLVVKSPANTRGYLDDPEGTSALQWGDGFIRTGDLASLDERGEIYILGRLKNVIHVAGMTISPMEVERIVDTVPGVRWTAALGLVHDELMGEDLSVFVEVSERLSDEARRTVVHDVTAKVHEQLGLRPAEVILLGSGAIPRTFNGKTQYEALRQTWISGALRGSGQVLA